MGCLDDLHRRCEELERRANVDPFKQALKLVTGEPDRFDQDRMEVLLYRNDLMGRIAEYVRAGVIRAVEENPRIFRNMRQRFLNLTIDIIGMESGDDMDKILHRCIEVYASANAYAAGAQSRLLQGMTEDPEEEPCILPFPGLVAAHIE